MSSELADTTATRRRSSTLVIPEGKPAFSQPLESELLVNEDDLLTLECIIAGNPLPEVTWFFNDRKIIVGNDYQRQSDTLNPHTIRHKLIINAKQKKLGVYKVQAQNTFGHTISTCHVKKSAHSIDKQKRAAFEEAELKAPPPSPPRRRSSVTAPNIAEPTQKPVIVQGLSTLQIDLGSPCAFTCKSKYDTEHQWLKDGQPLTEKSSRDGNIFMKTDRTNESNTHILNVKQFREENCGNYELIVKNSTGQVNSQGRLEMKGIPPSFILEPQSTAVVKGKTAEFNCRVAGSPKPGVILHYFPFDLLEHSPSLGSMVSQWKTFDFRWKSLRRRRTWFEYSSYQ